MWREDDISYSTSFFQCPNTIKSFVTGSQPIPRIKYANIKYNFTINYIVLFPTIFSHHFISQTCQPYLLT